MTREQKIGYSDLDPNNSEFISNDAMRHIIMEAVGRRLESDGTVAPVMTRRQKIYDADTGERWAIGPRINPVECEGPLILDKDYRAERKMPNGDIIREDARRTNLSCAIYDGMTGRHERAFSSNEIRVMSDGLQNLTSALRQAGYEKGEFELEQEMPSFQFGEVNEDGELPPTRLYLHRTDPWSPQIAAKLINSGARPDYGKLWIPYNQEGLQRYRHDTLILGFSDYGSLEQTVELLRESFMNSSDARVGAGEILYGLKVSGVPGAYIGQTADQGDSFNRNMADYLEKAIMQACQGTRQPRTGEVLTDEWLGDMAQKAARTLESILSGAGRTAHHALIDSGMTANLIKLASDAR